MPLKLANTGQKLPPLLLVSLVLFCKMTVIQMFDRFVIQSEYAVDACHGSSTKGSRPPRKQPSRGAGSISGCPFRGCREHYQVVGCKFVKLIFTLIYSMLFKLHAVQYPTLSRMACDYLAIQGSAVASVSILKWQTHGHCPSKLALWGYFRSLSDSQEWL